MINGSNIYLRDLDIQDINIRYLSWLFDPEVNHFLECRHSTIDMEGLMEQFVKTQSNPDIQFMAICLKETDEHIGNIKLGPINRIHDFSSVGILIGEKSHWGKGYACEAIRLLSEYAFSLGIRKLVAGAYSENYGSIKAFQRAGFKIEGCLKSQYRCEGQYQDGILLGLLNENNEQG